MRNPKFIVYFMLIFNYSCSKTSIPKNYENINVIKKLKDVSDTEVFIKEFSRYIENDKNDTLFIEEGTYTLEELIYNGQINKDVIIIGLGKVILKISKGLVYLKSPILTNEILNENLSFKDKFLKTKNIKQNFKNNLLIFIQSGDFVEYGWKYKKGELHKIKDIKNNTISMTDSLYFSYDYKEDVVFQVYDSKKLVIENLTFHVNDENKWDYQQILRTEGSIINAKNIKFKNFKKERESLFWGVYFCSDINISNFECENLLYGIAIDYSRGVTINNVIANNTQHPIVPATFTNNVYINNVRGINTSIDAHPSFNVHYNDVIIDTGMDGFNCRSMGVKLTNCIFNCSPHNNVNAIGIGEVGLRKEYEHIYKEYDVIIKNVKWKPQLNGFNGFHVGFCRDFLVDSCEVNQVSSGSPLRSYIVKNSKLGYFRSYDTNFEISNCIFDSKYQGLENPKSPIWCSFSGIATIGNCNFKGYHNAIFDFVSSSVSDITFDNCNFNTITKFANLYEYPGHSYKFIKFNKCDLRSIKEIPKELHLQRDQILKSNIIKINPFD